MTTEPAPAGPASGQPVRLGPAGVITQAAAERDPAIAEQLLRVVSLQDPPTRLFRPATAAPVLLGGLRRSLRRGPAPAVDATGASTPVSGPCG